MRAFIGRSFKDKDDDADIIRQIAEFIESQGIDCGDAKSAKSRKVEEKIRELIRDVIFLLGYSLAMSQSAKKRKRQSGIASHEIKTRSLRRLIG